jgi:hypothetical protein
MQVWVGGIPEMQARGGRGGGGASEMQGWVTCHAGARLLETQSEGYLKAPPSNLRALVKTTVLAGMFSPVENVSVANSTCNIRLDLTEQLQKSLGSMNFHAHAGYVLLLCYPSHLRCHTP